MFCPVAVIHIISLLIHLLIFTADILFLLIIVLYIYLLLKKHKKNITPRLNLNSSLHSKHHVY